MTTETMMERVERLGLADEASDANETRMERMERAHSLGVSDADFALLVRAKRTSDSDSIVLPAGRFEGLSRGKGWARLGSGGSAEWGERVRKGARVEGYRVGAGQWIVGSTDGFARKEQTGWDVRSIRVGGTTWLVAF